VAQGRVSHTKHTKPFRVIRLLCDQLGPFGSRIGKCSPRRRFITAQLSHYAFAPKSRNRNGFVVTPIDRQRIHSATRAIEIARAQASGQPHESYVFSFAGILHNNRPNCRD
jgi:hypothetical protein